jgi:hypothetical protein
MTPDEAEIRRLLAEYCHMIDDGAFDDLVERFAPDGTFAFGDLAATGREAILLWFHKMMAPQRRGKHLTTNILVDVDGDHATAASDFLFLGFVDGALVPVIVGRYHDELRRLDDRWVIQRRDATALEPPATTTQLP